MSCKPNSTSKSIKFQPMPMAALIANIKTLPDSSDSSDDSSSSVDAYIKKIHSKSVPSNSSTVKVPLSANHSSVKVPVEKRIEQTPSQVERASNKENISWSNKEYRFPGVDVLPTIQGSTSQPVTLDSPQNSQKHDLVVEKKESARCLFPSPSPKYGVKNPVCRPRAILPTETPVESSLQSTPAAKNMQAMQPTPVPQALVPQPTPVTQTQPTQQTPSAAATPSQPAGPRSLKIQFKTININGKKYIYIKKLGQGASSEVFKVLDMNTSREFAVKCVDLKNCHRELAQGFVNEVKLLRELQKSDRVVKLYEYEYDRPKQFLRLLMEPGETDLACFLGAHRKGAPPALVLHYWEEMLRAVQQIHEHDIVHADLKPGNFLLVSGRLKLIDFGIASAVSNDATSVVRSCGKGTFSYISPEALGGTGEHPYKVSFYSDVWSLGCILYSLIYGYTPFGHLHTTVKLVTIRDPNHTIAYPPVDCIPPTLMSALKSCLRYDAHSRPTVTQLLEIKHLQYTTRGLPEGLLDKLRPHVGPEEYALLQRATVYDQ